MEHGEANPEICRIATDCKRVFVDYVESLAVEEQAWARSAQGEFNLWCASIKATKSDKSSLDYRLRKDIWNDVREDICDLLRGLLQALRKCQHLADGE
jgi:hypothetical protein